MKRPSFMSRKENLAGVSPTHFDLIFFCIRALQQARSRKNITSITAITEIPEEVERTIASIA